MFKTKMYFRVLGNNVQSKNVLSCPPQKCVTKRRTFDTQESHVLRRPILEPKLCGYQIDFDDRVWAPNMVLVFKRTGSQQRVGGPKPQAQVRSSDEAPEEEENYDFGVQQQGARRRGEAPGLRPIAPSPGRKPKSQVQTCIKSNDVYASICATPRVVGTTTSWKRPQTHGFVTMPVQEGSGVI